MKTYRIAIDGNEANITSRVGSNVYAFELLVQLERLTRETAVYQVTVLLSRPPISELPAQREGWNYKVIGPKPIWTQIALPLHLYWNANKYDVLFTPGHYAPRLSSVPYVSSVMDLAYLKFPTYFKTNDLIQLKNWTAYSVKKAAHVIAISNFTKQAVVESYRKPADHITIAYPALYSDQHKVLASKEKAILRRHGVYGSRYVLYVGTLQPRKNLIGLIEAFEKVVRLEQATVNNKKRATQKPKSPLKLVIAGKVGWLADDILARVAASPLGENIILTGFIDDITKQVLYQHADVSAVVGLYEGFGIPALESLKFGCIPVVADNTSLPEVVGNAGIGVDPYKTEDMAAGILKVLNFNAKQRAQFAKAARTQLKEFSWVNSASIVLGVLRTVADKKSAKT